VYVFHFDGFKVHKRVDNFVVLRLAVRQKCCSYKLVDSCVSHLHVHVNVDTKSRQRRALNTLSHMEHLNVFIVYCIVYICCTFRFKIFHCKDISVLYIHV
jgi:hypothetical protein